MSQEEKRDNNKVFWSVIQGKLKTEVPETHPDAEVRHWEAGGKKGTKIERSVDSLRGIITDVSFYDGESDGRKFTTLNVVLDENEQGKKPVISTGISTRYAQDILKKLPEVELDKEVRFRPFSFTPDGEDKIVSGMEITQPDKIGKFTNKIGSFFHFQDGSGKWKAKDGYPLPEGDTSTYTSDDWQIYFKQVNRYLVNYCKEKIIPQFAAQEHAPKDITESFEKPQEINPDDIPF